MRTKNIIHITRADDLKNLHSLRRSIKKANTKIVLNLSLLNSTDNFYWQKKLNYHACTCGCGEGALGSLLGIIVIILSFRFSVFEFGSWTDFFSSSAFYFSFAGVALFAACGKLSGILYSRWRFKQIIRRLFELHNAN